MFDYIFTRLYVYTLTLTEADNLFNVVLVLVLLEINFIPQRSANFHLCESIYENEEGGLSHRDIHGLAVEVMHF